MSRRTLHRLMIIARIVLGGVFIYAGIIKSASPDAFAGSIAAYKILPFFGNYLVAATLPCVELLCGILLVTGAKTRAAATIVFVLNALFIAALVSTIIRGLDIDCGCFRQGGGKTSAWTALARDAVLLLMAAAVLRSVKHKERALS